jgi:hypothetical protein
MSKKLTQDPQYFGRAAYLERAKKAARENGIPMGRY